MKRTRQTRRAARSAAALAMAASLAGALVACGGSGAAETSDSAAATGTPAHSAGAGAARTAPQEALATIKGPQGIVMTLTSATREAGGFVTVSGTVRNTGDQPFTEAADWRGDEEALVKNGGSLAGATLVDLANKKRYYVLRDTDGRCLCSTGLDIIEPHATVPVFAQFPAPPATTTQVDFDVPTLPTASIVISR